VERSVTSLALAVASLVLAGFGVAGCGTNIAALQNAGKAASVNLSVNTVPTVRSVTVSPGNASFGNCTGGQTSADTHSTAGKLGFPNGECFVGLLNPNFYPIAITNTGIASDIYVSGSNAVPSDGGNQWSLCNPEGHFGSGCTRDHGKLPGIDQYLVEAFSPVVQQPVGISGTPSCDHAWNSSGGCWAVQGASQSEGIELIGPYFSSDTSTKWTMTITWVPVPG
jgi:hypothetical protein